MTLPIVSLAGDRAYPPRVTAFTKPFWTALADGQMTTVRCEACGKLTFPPKPICPHCWSDRMTWVPLATAGTLYARSVIHAAPAVFAHDVPYAVGIVDLDAGLRVAMRLIDPQPAIGDRVSLLVLSYEDGPLFAARRAETG